MPNFKLCKFRILPILLLVSLLLLPGTAYALGDRVPDLGDIQAGLTISFIYEGEDSSAEGIGGAGFTAYRVADMDARNGSVEWETLSPYTHYAVYENGRDLTYDGLTAEESIALASDMADLAISPYASVTTDPDGKAYIPIPAEDYGMFLIVQTGKADGYTETAPFLVAVPAYEGGVSEWDYTVTASPKKTVEKEPEAAQPVAESTGSTADSAAGNIKTGDIPDVAYLTGFIGAAGLAVLLTCTRKKEKEDRS